MGSILSITRNKNNLKTKTDFSGCGGASFSSCPSLPGAIWGWLLFKETARGTGFSFSCGCGPGFSFRCRFRDSPAVPVLWLPGLEPDPSSTLHGSTVLGETPLLFSSPKSPCLRGLTGVGEMGWVQGRQLLETRHPGEGHVHCCSSRCLATGSPPWVL